MKAAQMCRAIDDEREGKPSVVVLGEYCTEFFLRGVLTFCFADESDTEPAFWNLLGGFGPVKSAAEGGADDAPVAFSKKLFKYAP